MDKVTELREKVYRYKVGDYVEHDIEDGYAVRDICVVGTEDLDSLIAAAREEGAEQYRQQILGDSGTLVQEFCEQDVYVVRCEILDKPASVLSPAPKEPTIYAVGDNGEGGESHSATSSGGMSDYAFQREQQGGIIGLKCAKPIHLCRTCKRDFATCESHPTFASETDDTVRKCDTYEETEQRW